MALPDYSPGGFYDPKKTYRGGTVAGFTFPQGGLAQQIYGTEESPEAAYQNALQRFGLSGIGSRARRASSLFGESQLGFQQALMNDDVNMFYPEFLDQTNVGDVFNQQSFEGQGLNPGRFGQRKYRWGQRAG